MTLDNPIYKNVAENLLDRPNLDEILAGSYRDFHAKGLDYICLHRSKNLTVKAYLLRQSRGLVRLRDVVNPHDHAYNFDTFILSGQLQNACFTVGQWGEEWNKYNYFTPLNGKGEFRPAGKVFLNECERYTRVYGPSGHYYMEHWQIHTIRALSPNVTMLLFQYKEAPGVMEHGTSLFLKDSVTPDITGLYTRYTKPELEQDLNILLAQVRRKS